MKTLLLVVVLLIALLQQTAAYRKGSRRLKGQEDSTSSRILQNSNIFVHSPPPKEKCSKKQPLSKKNDNRRRLIHADLAKHKDECDDDSSDDLSDVDVCNQIINGASDKDSDHSMNVNIDMLLAIESEKAAVLSTLRDFLQAQLGIDLAHSCTGRRKLQEAATIENLNVTVTEDIDASCDLITNNPSITGECLNVDVLLALLYSGDPSGLPDRVRTSLLSFCDNIDNLQGVVKTFDPCSYITVDGVPLLDTTEAPASAPTVSTNPEPTAPTGGGSASDEDEEDDENGGGGFVGVGTEDRATPRQRLSWAGAIIVATGALLFCLLGIITFHKHRRDTAPLRHKALDDEDYSEDETYLRDDVSEHSWKPSTPRKTHVIGEDNSVATGWTGYTGVRASNVRNNTLYNMHDVHQCASATCEVCERRRQAGLQFIPAMPGSGNSVASDSRYSLPDSATREYSIPDHVSRDYSLEDTVNF